MKIKFSIIAIVPLLLFSCGTGEKGLEEYYFSVFNNTSHNVKIHVYHRDMYTGIPGDSVFTIAPLKKTYLIQYTIYPFNLLSDSARIVFNEERYLFFTKNDTSSRNILKDSNYTRNSHEYQFEITNRDYENAVPL